MHDGDDGQDVNGNLLAQVLLLQRVRSSGEVRFKARGEEIGGERGEEGERERGEEGERERESFQVSFRLLKFSSDKVR